jgi:hypothetical protein
MDILDFFWLTSHSAAIDGLHQEQLGAACTVARLSEIIRAMQQENDELRLRVGVLVRLLVQQGAVSEEQFGVAVQEAREKVALVQAESRRRQAVRVPSVRAKAPKVGPAKGK